MADVSGERNAVFIVLDVVVEADFYHIFRGLQRWRGLNSIN
jgi:hypothetical protein